MIPDGGMGGAAKASPMGKFLGLLTKVSKPGGGGKVHAV